MPNDNVLTIPRDLLQDLIDDVSDYAASREFKPREKVWRDDVLARARDLLATPLPEPRAEVTHGDTTMGECMASLLDRLEAAEVDADRYRYLRERDLGAVSVGGVFAGKTPDNVVLNGADLDAAVDAARTGASS